MEIKKLQAESYPMKGGDGSVSYYQNSKYQKAIVDAAKEMINEGVKDKLDFNSIPGFENFRTFCIADFGCSVGPNTFFAMENIIEAVKLKYQEEHQNHPPLEFQVLFNDHTNNDFNTLFMNLTQYSGKFFAAGVPGSFYGRLFPRSTLHFGYSSSALHWLSRVPKEVTDPESPAWNKNNIHYSGYSKEVVMAYSAQFQNDMETFLNARAQELVSGGLMAISALALPDGVLFSQTTFGLLLDLLGSCLTDMAKLGLVTEEKVETFNFPIYCPSVKELESLIAKNGCFSIERMEPLPNNMNPKFTPTVKSAIAGFRGVNEELIKRHFGDEMTASIFEHFAQKLSESISVITDGNVQKNIELFILLRRNIV